MECTITFSTIGPRSASSSVIAVTTVGTCMTGGFTPALLLEAQILQLPQRLVIARRGHSVASGLTGFEATSFS
jgi:hypothetical protein